MEHIVKQINVNGEIRQYDKSKINDVEEVLTLRQHRAKDFYENKFKSFFPGDKYKTVGLDKAAGIMYGYTTLDLKAELPKTKKRKAPLPGEEKYFTPEGFYQLRQMEKKLEALTAIVESLVPKKK